MFNGLDADGDGFITEKDLRTLLGTQDEYAAGIMMDCDATPAGLSFQAYMEVLCGSEHQFF